jgi:microsomal dipeptidase-like Zn-dependent dipeptidase
VGIGSDFDGIDKVPKGLEDVSKYPHLVSLNTLLQIVKAALWSSC